MGTDQDRSKFDGWIIHASGRHGVPPTIIKAQVYVENAQFKDRAYRYEPYTYDYVAVSWGASWRAGNPAIDELPFNLYNIEIPHNYHLGYAEEGERLTDADIAFREIYTLTDNSPADNVFDVWEIVDNNLNQNWDRPPQKFVAQTTIASSYGPLQVLWGTAVTSMNWGGGEGGPPVALASAAEGIDLGARYLRRLYDAYVKDYPSASWDTRWRTALVWYNRGRFVEDPPESNNWRDRTQEDGVYDDKVYDSLKWCAPN